MIQRQRTRAGRSVWAAPRGSRRGQGRCPAGCREGGPEWPHLRLVGYPRGARVPRRGWCVLRGRSSLVPSACSPRATTRAWRDTVPARDLATRHGDICRWTPRKGTGHEQGPRPTSKGRGCTWSGPKPPQPRAGAPSRLVSCIQSRGGFKTWTDVLDAAGVHVKLRLRRRLLTSGPRPAPPRSGPQASWGATPTLSAGLGAGPCPATVPLMLRTAP